MAAQKRGITIDIEANTSKLDKALKSIKKETSGIDRELKQVDRALKFNPTNVELWRQKQNLLKQKIDETKKSLEILKQKQASMDANGVDKNSAEYKKLQREIITTESKLKTFEGQLRKIGNVNLRATSEQVKEMGNKLESAGQAMRGLSMAAAAVAASLGVLTKKSAKWADDVVTASKVYSMSTGELQKYNAAAELVDVSADAIAKTHRKLERNMLNAQLGSKKQALAFQELGIEYQNTDGTLRDGDAVWTETIEALSKMTNETERDAYAMALMGRSATELNPLIEDGAEGYRLLTEAMEKYDLDFVDEETLQKANDFNDQLDTMKAIGTIALQTVGAQLAGYLVPALEKLVDLVGKFANWLSNLSPQVLTVIGIVATVIAVLAPVLMFLGKLSFAISSIMSLVATIGPAIGAALAAAGPIIAVIAAIIAVGVLLYKNWDTIKAKAQELWNHVKTVFTTLKDDVTKIWDGIKNAALTVWNTIVNEIRFRIHLIKTVVTTVFNAIKSVVTTVWNGIKTAITTPIQTAVNLVKNAINKIKSIINGAKLSLPKFKLPHFKINGGKLPWGIGGKGTPPKINVDWYAEGGIFDRASLIGVGEAGSEAVVPLDKFWSKLDAIADAAAQNQAVQGGPITVVVQLDGREIARTTAPYMETEINRIQNRANRKLGYI